MATRQLGVPAAVTFIIAVFGYFLPASQTESAKTIAKAEECKAATFEASLQGGQPYARQLGRGLVVRLVPISMSRPEENNGWIIKVTPKDKQDQDYALPLNPPLRQANSQWLATGYGISAREQLSQSHDVRFILNADDYAHIDKLMREALWPYQAAKPDEAAKRYLDTIAQLPSGLVRLVVKKFDTNDDGTEVNWIRFAVTVVVPTDFDIATQLKATNAGCPARP